MYILIYICIISIMNTTENLEKAERKRIAHNKRTNEYYHSHHEKMLEYQKIRQKEYYEKNKEKIREKNKEHQRKNREIIKQFKEIMTKL